MMTGCDEWGTRTLIEVDAALAVMRADGDERPDILYIVVCSHSECK